MLIDELKLELEKYETLQCSMFHEKVRMDTTGKPITNTIGDETFFERVSLCSSKIRQHRMGCAHSSSNPNFISLLDKLLKTHPGILPVKVEIEQILTEIYTLDHQKGNLEKEWAESDNKQDVQLLLDQCIAEHSACIERLESARIKVVQSI